MGTSKEKNTTFHIDLTDDERTRFQETGEELLKQAERLNDANFVWDEGHVLDISGPGNRTIRVDFRDEEDSCMMTRLRLEFNGDSEKTWKTMVDLEERKQFMNDILPETGIMATVSPRCFLAHMALSSRMMGLIKERDVFSLIAYQTPQETGEPLYRYAGQSFTHPQMPKTKRVLVDQQFIGGKLVYDMAQKDDRGYPLVKVDMYMKMAPMKLLPNALVKWAVRKMAPKEVKKFIDHVDEIAVAPSTE